MQRPGDVSTEIRPVVFDTCTAAAQAGGSVPAGPNAKPSTRPVIVPTTRRPSVMGGASSVVPPSGAEKTRVPSRAS